MHDAEHQRVGRRFVRIVTHRFRKRYVVQIGHQRAHFDRDVPDGQRVGRKGRQFRFQFPDPNVFFG